jgi:hypothetical protein
MSRYKGWILAVAIVSCGTVTAPIDTTDTIALHYVESQRVEPWGPELSGRQRPDWENAARDDLNRAGLTPRKLEQLDLRAAGLNPAVCDACPSLFVLRVEIPRSQEGTAIARCFVRNQPDLGTPTSESLTAARRTDCNPLYR